MRVTMRLRGLALAAALVGFAAGGALAQTYPQKPLRFVVPYPPGGGSDILARTIGHKLSENWGQPVVVDNRPGATNMIGTEIVAKAAPDGYTILIGDTGNAINPSLYRTMPFDQAKDFAPVTLTDLAPLILTVHPSVPVRTVKELIALAKSRPGQLNYASTSATTQLAMELFKIMAGVDLVHVPYKGFAPALTALLSGAVHVTFGPNLPTVPQVRAGKLKALAVSTARRSAALPDLPTVAESGLPGFEVTLWHGVLAPAGTPRDIVAKLNAEIVRILQLADVKERLSNQGLEIVGSTPEQFDALIKADITKYARVVKESGMRVD